jgi:hypothetical protein
MRGNQRPSNLYGTTKEAAEKSVLYQSTTLQAAEKPKALYQGTTLVVP